MLTEKGNINEKYNVDKLKRKITKNNLLEIINIIKQEYNFSSFENYLEISHSYSFAFETLLEIFKNAVFISDDAFESLLVYHLSDTLNKSFKIHHKHFSQKSLDELKLNEQFNFIFSCFGLSFEKLYEILPILTAYLKINGIICIIIPSCWYNRNNLNTYESQIINYAKNNDKKWIFTDEIEPVLKNTGCILNSKTDTGISVKLNLLETAKLFSLNKLYDSIINNNKAHLEIADLPYEGIKISGSLLFIEKKGRTITKDNIFNI